MGSRRDQLTVDEVVAAFDEHLGRTRGVCAGTRRNYVRFARGLLEAVFCDGQVDPTGVRAADVVGFVGELTRRFRPGTVGLAATSLRALFRFLRVEGLRSDRLEDVVPMVPMVPHGGGLLPRHLDSAQLDR